MPESRACYRKLKNYKYQLMQDYKMDIEIKPETDIETGFIGLTAEGLLTIKNRYAWDGPSGPTIDTRSFMREVLVHDALYQLMREGHLDHRHHREYADDLLKKICLDDRMTSIRAWWVHLAVRKFSEKHARPAPKPQDEIICVP